MKRHILITRAEYEVLICSNNEHGRPLPYPHSSLSTRKLDRLGCGALYITFGTRLTQHSITEIGAGAAESRESYCINLRAKSVVRVWMDAKRFRIRPVDTFVAACGDICLPLIRAITGTSAEGGDIKVL